MIIELLSSNNFTPSLTLSNNQANEAVGQKKYVSLIHIILCIYNIKGNLNLLIQIFARCFKFELFLNCW
jgi:hypothetical protein